MKNNITVLILSCFVTLNILGSAPAPTPGSGEFALRRPARALTSSGRRPEGIRIVTGWLGPSGSARRQLIEPGRAKARIACSQFLKHTLTEHPASWQVVG